MDLTGYFEADAFRAEIEEFLRRNLPADIAERGSRGYAFAKDDMRRWTAILHEKGWSVPSWPMEHGGPGWTPRQRLIFEECCYLAGAPQLSTQGVSLVGPVIYSIGSHWQQQRFLPGIRSGKEFWAQGFSEPDSGSDLASLRTRATRDGDEWVIEGRKIWTSEASDAAFIFLLARTDPCVRPQRGISFFLVPVGSPGVAVRPIRSIDGSRHLNETVYDSVRVPHSHLVGQEGKGWTYAKQLLLSERAFAAEIPRNRGHLARLVRLACAPDAAGRRPIDCPIAASSIAAARAALEALEALTLEALAQHDLDVEQLPLASALKIKGSEMQQRLLGLAVDLLGPDALPFFPPPGSGPLPDYAATRPHSPGAVAAHFFRRGASIAGGTNEIQRSIIAKAISR